MGKPWPFSSFAIQNFIKTTIFKLMVLCNTLVSDSENWPTYSTNSGLLFPVMCFVFVSGEALYRSCRIRDKSPLSLDFLLDLADHALNNDSDC